MSSEWKSTVCLLLIAQKNVQSSNLQVAMKYLVNEQKQTNVWNVIYDNVAWSCIVSRCKIRTKFLKSRPWCEEARLSINNITWYTLNLLNELNYMVSSTHKNLLRLTFLTMCVIEDRRKQAWEILSRYNLSILTFNWFLTFFWYRQ